MGVLRAWSRWTLTSLWMRQMSRTGRSKSSTAGHGDRMGQDGVTREPPQCWGKAYAPRGEKGLWTRFERIWMMAIWARQKKDRKWLRKVVDGAT